MEGGTTAPSNSGEEGTYERHRSSTLAYTQSYREPLDDCVKGHVNIEDEINPESIISQLCLFE